MQTSIPGIVRAVLLKVPLAPAMYCCQNLRGRTISVEHLSNEGFRTIPARTGLLRSGDDERPDNECLKRYSAILANNSVLLRPISYHHRPLMCAVHRFCIGEE